ncbi:hypothetical protein NSS79_20460 [Paenibacillus sp. FSL L8-0436]|uniref:hypothetical protein n=1 Tax=Paenibacillus sp. FSL L8-0436 TaxID=2954686 RepID=UPI00315942D2
MEKTRYVVSPYSYMGDSSRPRTYSVWDTVTKEWSGDYVGNKAEAQEEADKLNYKYFECPQCNFIQVEEATVDYVKCDRCNHIY